MLDILLKRQAELGMTQAQFAKHLGIPRTTWTLTISEYVPVGKRVINAVLRKMPELTPEVTMYLRDKIVSEDTVSTARRVSTSNGSEHKRHRRVSRPRKDGDAIPTEALVQ